MSLELTASRALFIQDAIVAGECVLDDPFKPYIHPMRTPAGHVVTSAMPVDHRHHKGLMFALRCADLNFWEENPGSPDCGVQKILAAHTENDALLLELLWCDEAGGFQTYHEHRRVSCAPGPRGGFHWTWHSHRKALRDHCLIQSEWSCQLPDGRKLNYHGLGVRLPWAWSWPGSNLCGVKIDGTPVEPEKACGTHGPSVTW